MCLLILQAGIRWTQSYSPWCLWAPAYLPGQGKSQTLQASPMELHRTHMTCKAAGLKRKPGGTKSTTLISSLKCIGQMHFSHTFLSWGVEHKVTPPLYYVNVDGDWFLHSVDYSFHLLFSQLFGKILESGKYFPSPKHENIYSYFGSFSQFSMVFILAGAH